MISGFKIGLRDWKEKLEQCKALTGSYPAYVEIYFRVDKIPEYDAMFSFLEKNNIKSGLHFWGVLKSSPPTGEAGIEPNLLSSHKWIQNQSVMLMQSAIKVAASHKCVYLNVHPGALKERTLDLDESAYQMAKLPETTYEEGRKNLLSNAARLSKIAEKYGVLLTFETLPMNCPKNWLAPHNAKNLLIAKQCPVEFYGDLIDNGYFVANDFGHTVASIDTNTDRYRNLSLQENREIVLKHLFDWTKKLAPRTRLIHCNLTLPPFDGVDEHLGLLPEDFAKDSLPKKQELIGLLKIFKGREDIYVLNEPESCHVENYIELVELLKSI